jgi:hypothetical protein
MPGLTDQQQGWITLVAEVLQALSLVAIPTTLEGQTPAWLPVLLFLCGAVAKGLMQFQGSPQTQQQTVLDSLSSFATAYAAMTPTEQTALLAQLPTLLPLLVKPQPTPKA